MARKLKYDIPGPDWRRTADDLATSGWEVLFGVGTETPRQRVVEIGFGRQTANFLDRLARLRGREVHHAREPGRAERARQFLGQLGHGVARVEPDEEPAFGDAR